MPRARVVKPSSSIVSSDRHVAVGGRRARRAAAALAGGEAAGRDAGPRVFLEGGQLSRGASGAERPVPEVRGPGTPRPRPRRGRRTRPPTRGRRVRFEAPAEEETRKRGGCCHLRPDVTVGGRASQSAEGGPRSPSLPMAVKTANEAARRRRGPGFCGPFQFPKTKPSMPAARHRTPRGQAPLVRLPKASFTMLAPCTELIRRRHPTDEGGPH